jgi:hypothetical protein
MPAGPIGTVLMATLLLKTSLHTLREIRRQEQPLVGLEQAEA